MYMLATHADLPLGYWNVHPMGKLERVRDTWRSILQSHSAKVPCVGDSPHPPQAHCLNKWTATEYERVGEKRDAPLFLFNARGKLHIDTSSLAVLSPTSSALFFLLCLSFLPSIQVSIQQCSDTTMDGPQIEWDRMEKHTQNPIS